MKKSNELPSPAENPTGDIVIYDGKCVFCTSGVRRLRQFDGADRLAFVSLHDPLVAEQFPDLSRDMLMDQMYVIPHSAPEKRYGGAAAIRYLTRRLPKLWWAAPLLHVPFSMPLWQVLYRWVAKRRYKIANRNGQCDEDGTCELHSGDRMEKQEG